MRRGQFNKENPTHFDFGASLRKEYGESSFNRVVRQYKKNAVRRNLVFELTNEQVRSLTSANCTYCGIEPSSIMKMPDAYGEYVYNGIDRQDSTVGYTIENCVTACSTCNKAKGNLPLEIWLMWIKRIRANGDK